MLMIEKMRRCGALHMEVVRGVDSPFRRPRHKRSGPPYGHCNSVREKHIAGEVIRYGCDSAQVS